MGLYWITETQVVADQQDTKPDKLQAIKNENQGPYYLELPMASAKE
jgi:uncharacterized membrane protein (UPF0127 family)